MRLDKDGPGYEALRHDIEENQFDVVVVDPIYKTLWESPNDAEVIVRLIHALDKLRTEFGFALVIPMHMRKSDRFTMQDLLGSVLFSAWPDTIMGIRRMAGRETELHFFKDRQGDLPVNSKWTLELDETLGWVRKDAPDDAKACREAIWRLLQTEKREQLVTRREIWEALGGNSRFNEQWVARCCKEFERDIEGDPDRDIPPQPDLWPGLQVRKRGNTHLLIYTGQMRTMSADADVDRIKESFDAEEVPL